MKNIPPEIYYQLARESSMLNWYPKIKDLHILQPKTEIVEIDHFELAGMIEHEKIFTNDRINQLKKAIERVGGYPVFMRTDQSSMKHDWEKTCFVKNEETLLDNISNLIEGNEIVGGLMGLPYKALVFREYIEMDSGFTAFHGKLPVNIEARFFVRNGRVQCWHPYWPESAIEHDAKYYPISDDNWREILKNQSSLDPTITVPDLVTKAKIVSKEFGDVYWSVDFSKSRDYGKWYLIDMARGDISFHYPGCRYEF